MVGRRLRSEMAANRDHVGRRQKQRMSGHGAGQSGVFQRSGWAEDGLGQLAIAGMSIDLDLSVEAAVAGLWMAQS